jgi:hypothetical protein
MIRLTRSFALGIGLMSFAFMANIAFAVEPPPPPKIETKLPIRASYPVKIHPPSAEQNEKVILRLPESVVRELAAKLNEKGSSAVPPGSSFGEDAPPRSLPASALPHGATIVAGCALSLAMISFMLLRQRRSRGAWLGGAAGVILLGVLVANYSQANVPPPPDYHLKLEKQFNSCLIFIVPDGGEVEVFLSDKPPPAPR